MKSLLNQIPATGARLFAGLPEGYDALCLAQSIADGLTRDLIVVARDDVSMAAWAERLRFFAPEQAIISVPAWDCLPYDRSSPAGEILAQRVEAFSTLAAGKGPYLVLTTISALLQRIPARESFAGRVLHLKAGDAPTPDAVTAFLAKNSYQRADTVMEPGEFAVRGGIIDVFPPGSAKPVRLDFFGDDLEGIRAFDPISQRTTEKCSSVIFKPVGELILDEASISRFRSAYRELFGTPDKDDTLYVAVSEGRRHQGLEHWLPLFHERLETLFDYLPKAAVLMDYQADQAADARFELIDEYYQARLDLGAGGGAYHPVPKEQLYLDAAEWRRRLSERGCANLTPFAAPEELVNSVDFEGRPGANFAEARVRDDANVYDALAVHAAEQVKAGRRVMIAGYTKGSRDRLLSVMREHGLKNLAALETWAEADAAPKTQITLLPLAVERGFVAPGVALISEQDILGERVARPQKASRIRPENFITEASSLNPGDLVVHVDHGIGRYEGLEAIKVSGAPHDCLKLIYDGDDKLFLPVENIELISRYGSEDAAAQLDKLGGAAWQARKARMKQRIREMADELIKIAAARELRPAPQLSPPEGMFDEFCARFPYTETEDQARAIFDTIDDMAKGRPTDRLVCGDVGFGKTEVALRAAFVCAMSGKQVAVVVPTTLLCRQHFKTFQERFRDFPVRIAQLSRLVTPKQAKATKEELKKGTVDIVIGTHALLSGDVGFRDLGLLVVDEEQHFGVAHKEKLKKLKTDVHVLTLSATPIPRTLQLALSGVREMSLIATPPVDRLAVRTYVLPFDPVVIREAILRERYRGGQTFYVCPRIEDLDEVAEQLRELVPEVKLGMAHGRMPVRELEGVIEQFYDGAFDILLSTNIVESGLDLPQVNTIVLHRADMFGLGQLYQLRGRVGRSKTRAYAYLTLPPKRKLTAAAEKRLEVMQTLDSLGAGFTLASHDLDIRGAGNLLGDEQSGHIREVGIELYQQMLEEAVAEARGGGAAFADEEWSPQISTGLAVLIPDWYVADLGLRMSLYRRLAGLTGAEEIEAFAAELIDRFGPIPSEAENLMQTVRLKLFCKAANVEKVDAGPKGAMVGFRSDYFANPQGLVAFLADQKGTAKLRPDHKLVFSRNWETPKERFEGVRYLLGELAKIAEANA